MLRRRLLPLLIGLLLWEIYFFYLQHSPATAPVRTQHAEVSAPHTAPLPAEVKE
ncbi:hypothetical protein ACFOSS_00865 [Pseudaeromonas sharmana]|uniref:Uncharacterized protein n=1 Tax=Pseudaeromonas sharmana TaxID=328412 RepID=A0ABV8CIT2_9GAMM